MIPKLNGQTGLNQKLKKGRLVEFSPDKIRTSLYSPFTKLNLYFDKLLNQRTYLFPSIFPTLGTEKENRVICVPSVGGRADFWCSLAQYNPRI